MDNVVPRWCPFVLDLTLACFTAGSGDTTMFRRHCMWLPLVVVAMLAPAAAQSQSSGSATIDGARAKGFLACGVSTGNPGFSLIDSQGRMNGIDADTCRAVAAAVLGDGDKVKFFPLTSTNRFTALQTGEVDLLVRSATWTLGREASLGLLFAGINFYDGTGFMVPATSGVTSAKGLSGAAVCIPAGSSMEPVADFFRRNDVKFTPVLIEDQSEIRKAYLSGRCDAFCTDLSSLATFRYSLADHASEHVLLPDVLAKEPLGLAVRKGDDRFFDAVRWTMFAMFQAEESGVTRDNVDRMRSSDDPTTRRLLGLEGDLGKAMGLDPLWVVNIVKSVGNYGEMWERDITPMGIPRGRNNLYINGGLQYSPPFR